MSIICENKKIKTLKDYNLFEDTMFDCRECYDLEDISNLPSMIEFINIKDCENIKTFTTKINNFHNKLVFLAPTERVAQRIREWPCYRIVSEQYTWDYTPAYITVEIKDNIAFMENL